MTGHAYRVQKLADMNKTNADELDAIKAAQLAGRPVTRKRVLRLQKSVKEAVRLERSLKLETPSAGPEHQEVQRGTLTKRIGLAIEKLQAIAADCDECKGLGFLNEQLDVHLVTDGEHVAPQIGCGAKRPVACAGCCDVLDVITILNSLEVPL